MPVLVVVHLHLMPLNVLWTLVFNLFHAGKDIDLFC